MAYEPVTVGSKGKWNIQGLGIIECLLHAVADAVGVILGLDHCQWNVRLVMENVIGPLGAAARDQPAAHDDAPLGETHLFADLFHHVPVGLDQGRRDTFGADIAFAQGALVHTIGPLSRPSCQESPVIACRVLMDPLVRRLSILNR